jgi:predicted AlkP superfamily phosphohydrolase/phosphomutase
MRWSNRITRRHFLRWMAGLAGAAAACYFLVPALTRRLKAKPFDGRIIILAFDGLSPHIMEPLLARGELPHFAQLARDGSYARLATSNPAQTPVAFTGFATGKNPGAHGLFDFIHRDPKLLDDPEHPALALSTTQFEGNNAWPVITLPRFWDHASDLGVPSVILNFPVTFPPDRLDGRMLSGMGVPDILGTEGTFTFYTSEGITGPDAGGKVVPVSVALEIDEFLNGPKHQTTHGIDHAKVPMHLTVDVQAHTIIVDIKGGDRFTLKQGEWSNWHGVTFSLGMFKKMKGIARFYLVRADEEALKLYVGPINFDPRDPAFPISHPESYAKELAEQFGLYYTQGIPFDTWAVNEHRLTERPFLECVQSVIAQNRKMLDYELERAKTGIIFSYFGATDLVQHMFWGYADPENHFLYAKDNPYEQTIAQLYRQADEILGEVRTQLGAKDTLIVMSDHGFAAFRRAVNVNGWLLRQGYLALNEGKSEGGELLLDIDWAKTRAYAIGFGAIYLNQRGREACGIVAPGSESEALKNELAEKLKAWTDGDETPVVNHVYTRQEIFWGDRAEEAPDLFLGFRNGYRASWQTALGAVPVATIEDNAKNWSGDHLVDPVLVPGILFANRALNRENPTIYDLAPTILQVIGCTSDELEAFNYDGKPLF